MQPGKRNPSVVGTAPPDARILESVDVVIIDPDFSHRKMLVGFGKKLGRQSADAESLTELSARPLDWFDVQAAVVRLRAPHSDAADIANRLHRLSPDLCIYFVVDEGVQPQQLPNDLPVGTSFLWTPVSLAMLRVALENCAIVHTRTRARRREQQRRLTDLLTIQETLLQQSDIGGDGGLAAYFKFVDHTLARHLQTDGFAVLERRGNVQRWNVAYARGIEQLSLGQHVRDAGDLRTFMEADEPQAIPAGSADPLTPALRGLAGRHLLFAPERMSLYQLDYLWIAVRNTQRTEFQTWALAEARELTLLARLAMDGSLMAHRMLERFGRFLAIAPERDADTETTVWLKRWAIDIAAAVGSEHFVLAYPGADHARRGINMTAGHLDRKSLEELDAKARFVPLGGVETIAMVTTDGRQIEGLLANIAERSAGPWWLFIDLQSSPHQIDRLMLEHALPTLIEAVTQRLHPPMEN